MGREATNAQIIQNLSHLFGLVLGPIEIGSIKFDTLISHLSNFAYGAFRILFQLFPYRVELEANRDLAGFAAVKSPGKHRRKSQEGASGERSWSHECKILVDSGKR